jgi:hypothetical protein
MSEAVRDVEQYDVRLTPWNSVAFWKLVFPRLVNKFSSFCGITKFIHSSLYHVLILSQISPGHTFPFAPSSSSSSSSSWWSWLCSSSVICVIFYRQSLRLRFNRFHYIRWWTQVSEIPLCKRFAAFYYISRLGSNILLSTLSSVILSLCSYPNARGQILR